MLKRTGCSRSSGSGRQLAALLESGTDGLSLVLGYDEHRRSMGDRTTTGKHLRLGVATRRVLTCCGLAGASPAPSFPGAVANPVHFFGTKNAAGVYPDRRDAIIWERRMENAGVGWIAAIIIGGLAGWLAEKFMKSEMGLFMNIVLGIVGAAVASAILSVVGINLAGWIGYLIAGFVGACLLIWIVRAFKKA